MQLTLVTFFCKNRRPFHFIEVLPCLWNSMNDLALEVCKILSVWLAWPISSDGPVMVGVRTVLAFYKTNHVRLTWDLDVFANRFCREKTINVTYFCVFVLARELVHVPERVGVWMGVRACSLAYPVCNSCTPCCDSLWCLWIHRIFRHYLIKGTIFGKKLLSIKFVFSFSLQLLSKTFFILRRIKRNIIINVKTSPCKVPLFLFLILIIIQRDIVIHVKTPSCKVPVILVEV